MTIKTTHVGSLPRPFEVSQLLFDLEERKRIKDKSAEDIFDKAVLEVVQRQKKIGIDIPSDGEISKISYATYIGERVEGFEGDSPRTPPADLQDFPEYLKKIAASGGTPNYKRPQCVRELKNYKIEFLNKDIARFWKALHHNNYEIGFLNSASPGVIAMFQPTTYYKNFNDYIMALSSIMQQEYQAIIKEGLLLQIDAPDLALGRHMMYSELNEKEFLQKLDLHLLAIHKAIDGLPKEKIRLHLCWGNYEGPHHRDIELKSILSRILDLNIGYLLVEAANPRHSHEWEVWGNINLPQNFVVVPGVIDSTTNFIEHPQLIKQRLQQFTTVLNPENIMAGSDCGFATFAGFGAVDANIAYKKLENMCKGVRLFNENKES